MTRTILLDCDDVLLNWIGGFRFYASSRLERTIKGMPQSWDMGAWLGTTSAVAVELIQEFNASSEFGFLRAVNGSKEVIARLHADREIRLHVITSCSSDIDTVRMRRLNIEREFGEDVFDSIHCLDLGQPKLKILQAWSPGAIWVEDNYKNALMGADAGHKVLMRERPHNAQFRDLHDARVVWFKEWDELGAAI